MDRSLLYGRLYHHSHLRLYLREHIFDVAKLHAFRANRKINAGEHEQRNKNVGIHEVIDVARYQNEETVDAIRLHRVFFLEKSMRILL